MYIWSTSLTFDIGYNFVDASLPHCQLCHFHNSVWLLILHIMAFSEPSYECILNIIDMKLMAAEVNSFKTSLLCNFVKISSPQDWRVTTAQTPLSAQTPWLCSTLWAWNVVIYRNCPRIVLEMSILLLLLLWMEIDFFLSLSCCCCLVIIVDILVLLLSQINFTEIRIPFLTFPPVLSKPPQSPAS